MSKRLGQPKQLLQYKGTGLLQHTIDAAEASLVDNIIVVLGSGHEKIQSELRTHKAFVRYNPKWAEGMASSIREGITASIERYPETDGILFMVCDQPFVSGVLLNRLVQTQNETGNPIVASQYGEVVGTPALFHSSLFPELMSLQGDKGARKILANHPDELSIVNFENGIIDIDTKADYENLLNKK